MALMAPPPAEQAACIALQSLSFHGASPAVLMPQYATSPLLQGVCAVSAAAGAPAWLAEVFQSIPNQLWQKLSRQEGGLKCERGPNARGWTAQETHAGHCAGEPAAGAVFRLHGSDAEAAVRRLPMTAFSSLLAHTRYDP